MATSKVSPGFFEWTEPVPRKHWDPLDPELLQAARQYEEVEQRIGYNFRDKGFLVMAFTHSSLPESLRIVPEGMDPMNVLGESWLKYFIAGKLYGFTDPLCPRSIHDATSHVVSNHSLALAVVRHGWYRLLRTGSARLNDDVVNYVRSIDNAEYPGYSTKVPPKVLADAFRDSHHDLAATWHSLYSLLRSHIDSEIAAVAAKSTSYFF
ncbi:hypothetical protein MTO96_030651 [Rhipicephalus appendiculatus]